MSKTIINVAFLMVCIGIVVFLLNAPDKTTSPLPMDKHHNNLFAMPKKQAEKQCISCHNEDSPIAPIPKDHPPKFRCLFCHTRD
ncbi:MAG: hypothetical protein OCC45_16365 [Desulfotalea sp.]